MFPTTIAGPKQAATGGRVAAEQPGRLVVVKSVEDCDEPRKVLHASFFGGQNSTPPSMIGALLMPPPHSGIGASPHALRDRYRQLY